MGKIVSINGRSDGKGVPALDKRDYGLPDSLFSGKLFKGRLTTLVDANRETWFVGSEIAELLGYSNTSDAVQSLVDREDRVQIAFHDLQNMGLEVGTKGGTIINESGLYSLVMRSKLEDAKPFRRWVTSEVLPAIRKNGFYGESDTIEDAKAISAKAVSDLVRSGMLLGKPSHRIRKAISHLGDVGITMSVMAILDASMHNKDADFTKRERFSKSLLAEVEVMGIKALVQPGKEGWERMGSLADLEIAKGEIHKYQLKRCRQEIARLKPL